MDGDTQIKPDLITMPSLGSVETDEHIPQGYTAEVVQDEQGVGMALRSPSGGTGFVPLDHRGPYVILQLWAAHDQQAKANDDLLATLKAVEWNDSTMVDGGMRAGSCPSCGGIHPHDYNADYAYPHQTMGHSPECELAAVLAKAEGTKMTNVSRLSAASPDLLSCLVAYVEIEEQAAPASSSPLRERARAAIAKAKDGRDG